MLHRDPYLEYNPLPSKHPIIAAAASNRLEYAGHTSVGMSIWRNVFFRPHKGTERLWSKIEHAEKCPDGSYIIHRTNSSSGFRTFKFSLLFVDHNRRCYALLYERDWENERNEDTVWVLVIYTGLKEHFI